MIFHQIVGGSRERRERREGKRESGPQVADFLPKVIWAGFVSRWGGRSNTAKGGPQRGLLHRGNNRATTERIQRGGELRCCVRVRVGVRSCNCPVTISLSYSLISTPSYNTNDRPESTSDLVSGATKHHALAPALSSVSTQTHYPRPRKRSERPCFSHPSPIFCDSVQHNLCCVCIRLVSLQPYFCTKF